MMKNKIKVLVSILFFCAISIFAQVKNEFNLIQLDSTWGQEVLRFPARNMDYTGVGEVRFPPKGWIHPDHTFYWSYTYSWKIDLNEKISTKELETDLVKYFDSLNNIDLVDVTNERKATSKINEIKTVKSTTFFEGKVHTFDRFATNKRFTLNVKIESNFCEKTKKTVLLFTFSPKEFNHEVWKTLDEIKLIDGFCKE